MNVSSVNETRTVNMSLSSEHASCVPFESNSYGFWRNNHFSNVSGNDDPVDLDAGNDSVRSLNCDSCSLMNDTDTESCEFSHAADAMRASREEYVEMWVQTTSSEDTDFEMEPDSLTDSDSTITSVNSVNTNRKTEEFFYDSDSSGYDVVFTEVFSDDDESSDTSLSFEGAVTEDKMMPGASCSTRGSLNIDEAEFLDDDDSDRELLFIPPLSSPSYNARIDEPSTSQDYINEGFEDMLSQPREESKLPEYLTCINNKWSSSMLDVKDGPKEPVKVSFASESDLVHVHTYEQIIVEDLSAMSLVLDRMRFQRRIKEFGELMDPYLSISHRYKIAMRNSVFSGN